MPMRVLLVGLVLTLDLVSQGGRFKAAAQTVPADANGKAIPNTKRRCLDEANTTVDQFSELLRRTEVRPLPRSLVEPR